MIHTMKPVNYPKCMELYNQVVELGKDDKDKDVERFVTFAYNNIGDIYENTGKTEQAKDYYLKAYGQARKDDEIFVSDKMEIIENLSRIYEKLNDFKQSLFYAREAKNVIKKYNKEQISNQARALEIFTRLNKKTF